MLDIKFIRDNKDIVIAGAKKKHIDVDIEKLITLDDKRRELLKVVEDMRAKQNTITKEISTEQNQEMRASKIAEMQKLKEQIQKENDKLKDVLKEWQQLMLLVPNVPDISVPEGESDEDNVEVKVWGDVPSFDFEIKDHITLMQNLDMVDLERGTKVAGFRGYFLKNDGAMLEWAIFHFAQEFFLQRNFTPMIVPSLLNKEPFIGTGYLPQEEENLYKTQDDKYLAGTAEVAVMSYFMDETLKESDLPFKAFAFSPCFRREAGSHGKDTKGLIRVHEFFKYEQVVLCEASHETSVRIHEELTKNSEEFLQALGIPYHIVVNCGGDIGLGQVKKYDIEAWMPSQNKYRETHSSSYFHDFQTRRLGIKYKDSNGNLRYAHSLNNTAIAGPRILAVLVENYQQPDGSIVVPEVLRKYVGKEKITKET